MAHGAGRGAHGAGRGAHGAGRIGSRARRHMGGSEFSRLQLLPLFVISSIRCTTRKNMRPCHQCSYPISVFQKPPFIFLIMLDLFLLKARKKRESRRASECRGIEALHVSLNYPCFTLLFKSRIFGRSFKKCKVDLHFDGSELYAKTIFTP